MSIAGQRISVVIPCHNEAEGLKWLLPQLKSWADEIIVVDNDSDDGSATVAGVHEAKVAEEKIRGYGSAYRRGLPPASGDIIVTLDGDGSYAPEDARRLALVLCEKQVDFVSGSRFPLKDARAMPWINRLANTFITMLARILFQIKLDDSQSGMWVFRRELLARVMPEHRGMSFSQEIKLNALLDNSIRFHEEMITYHRRIGEVKFRAIRDAYGNLAGLLKYYFSR